MVQIPEEWAGEEDVPYHMEQWQSPSSISCTPALVLGVAKPDLTCTQLYNDCAQGAKGPPPPTPPGRRILNPYFDGIGLEF